jgi:hypothetical protein
MWNKTWWDVMDLIDNPKATFEDRRAGLEIVAGSEMPVEVAAAAGQLLLELDALQQKLKGLTREVGHNANNVMRPV